MRGYHGCRWGFRCSGCCRSRRSGWGSGSRRCRRCVRFRKKGLFTEGTFLWQETFGGKYGFSAVWARRGFNPGICFGWSKTHDHSSLDLAVTCFRGLSFESFEQPFLLMRARRGEWRLSWKPLDMPRDGSSIDAAMKLRIGWGFCNSDCLQFQNGNEICDAVFS